MLCENCQQSVLRDDSPAFRAATDDFGDRSVVTDKESLISTNYFLLDHFPELPQLRESAFSGCEFCSFLRESLLSRDTANLLQENYGLRITSLNEEKITLQIQYIWNRDMGVPAGKRNFLCVVVNFAATTIDFGIFCTIRAAEKGDSVAEWLCLDESSPQVANSPGTIRWIKKRIQECRTHEHELPGSEFVPRLLLDVRGKMPKLMDQDTLLSTRKTRGQLKLQTPIYAALSYCWGTAEDAKAQITTTRSSFSQRQAGIETEDITAVLQDAIIITKQLSIPYLWIDSLCIFQDDITDWYQQCMDMDKIYGHAEITILAASSTSCREGFIQRRSPRVRVPFNSILNQTLHGSMWINFQGVQASTLRPPTEIFSDIYQSRLATRGWAFQERILSTRQIVFGKWDAHFLCPKENQTHGEPSCLFAYTISIHSARATRDTEELYDEWASILNEFSRINAHSYTCATDLLPSISGLAADFAKRLKDNYFAGHWGNDLVMGLLWAIDGGIRVSKSVHLSHVTSPIQYLAPSWSQLFQSTKTMAFRRRQWVGPYHPTVKSIGAHTVTAGSNAFGAIKNGELRVRSYCMSLQGRDVIQFKSITPFDQIAQWRMRFEQDADGDLFCDVFLDYDLPIMEVHEEVKSWKWILLGTYRIAYVSTVRQTEEHEEDMYPFGLLVHEIKHSEWCRIGIFMPAYEGPRLSLQTFQMASTLEDIIVI